VSLLEALRESQLLVTRGYGLEALGRKLAVARDEPVGADDIYLVEEIPYWYEDVYEFCDRVRSKLFTDREADIASTLYEEVAWIRHYFASIYDNATRAGARRRDRMVSVSPSILVEELTAHMVRYDKAQARLTGRSGIWLFKRAMTLEEYTFSAFLNDYTSCFHQFLNWLNRRIGSVKEVADRVYATPDASQASISTASSWREAVEVYNTWNLYSPEDYNALYALCKPVETEFRVGSAIGHTTHIAIRPIFLEASYYDRDESVHTVFIELCEHYGCRIKQHEIGDVTVVAVPRIRAADFMQGVLPFTTSMDLRIGNPGYYWGSRFKEELRELEKGVPVLSELREFDLCVEAYKRFLKERGYKP
jgi:hypothetical protein